MSDFCNSIDSSSDEDEVEEGIQEEGEGSEAAGGQEESSESDKSPEDARSGKKQAKSKEHKIKKNSHVQKQMNGCTDLITCLIVFCYAETKVSRTSKQLSFLDILRVKFEGEHENKKKELDNEARRLALQEREMSLREAEAKRQRMDPPKEKVNANPVGLPPTAGQPMYHVVERWDGIN